MKEEKIAREVIVTIIENVNFLYDVSGEKTIHAAIDSIKKEPSLKASVENAYGVTLRLILKLLKLGVINQDVMELTA